MVCRYKAIKVDGKKIDEHRHLMQVKLGRKLSFNEIVHHKDGNPRNNELTNLELKIRAKHTKEFMTGKSWKRETHKNKDGKYWCNSCKKYLPKASFHLNNQKKYGIQTYCKRCRVKKMSP